LKFDQRSTLSLTKLLLGEELSRGRNLKMKIFLFAFGLVLFVTIKESRGKEDDKVSISLSASFSSKFIKRLTFWSFLTGDNYYPISAIVFLVPS
jgi:hypothetical protein